MKTKLITLLAAVLIAQLSFAQFHLGAKAGANITKIQGKSFNDEFRYGYHIGGFMELRLGNKFVLQPEVLFNQFTTSVDSSFSNVYHNAFHSSQSSKKLNYLTVPILLNYRLIGSFLSLQAGPAFGVLMNSEKNLLENGAEAFKKGEFSMMGGAQVKIGPIRVNGRYVIGLNNLNDIGNESRWRNEGFQLSLGLAL